MKLYLMRHGQAEATAPSDAQRALTAHGVRQATAMGAFLLAEPPHSVYTSPYLRAVQTTEAVLSGAGLSSLGYSLAPGITPDDDPRVAFKWLARLGDRGPVLVVSHNPFISLLFSLLTQGHLQAGVSLSTADLVCLDTGDEGISPGGATVAWVERAP